QHAIDRRIVGWKMGEIECAILASRGSRFAIRGSRFAARENLSVHLRIANGELRIAIHSILWRIATRARIHQFERILQYRHHAHWSRGPPPAPSRLRTRSLAFGAGRRRSSRARIHQFERILQYRHHAETK